MPTKREPKQVAKRAMVLGGITLRASLELSNHPNRAEYSSKIPKWLHNIGCDDEIDPIENELLATPFGELSDSQRVDANWAGEAAAFYCWMLKLAPQPDANTASDQSSVLTALKVLRPEAVELIESASLQAHQEIEHLCQHFVLIRSILQELNVDSAVSPLVWQANLQRLNEVGITVSQESVHRASEAADRMSPDQKRRIAGLYFVRDHAAFWFLSGRDRYFNGDA